MHCKTYTSPDGKFAAIVCGSTRFAKPCQWSEGTGGHRRVCNSAHTKLCDFKLTGPNEGKTCDMRMCDEHATEVGENVHYCQIHSKWAEVDRTEPPSRKKTKPLPSSAEEAMAVFR